MAKKPVPIPVFDQIKTGLEDCQAHAQGKRSLRSIVVGEKYQVVLEPCPDDGGYTACVPALPGCIGEGDTEEAALGNIEAAIALYLETV